jgi:hypothetical protein
MVHLFLDPTKGIFLSGHPTEMLAVPHKLALQSFEELIDLKSYVLLIPVACGTRQGSGELGSKRSPAKLVGHGLILSWRDLVLLGLLEMFELPRQFNDGSHDDFIVNLDRFVDIWMLLSCLMHFAKYFPRGPDGASFQRCAAVHADG